MKLVDFTALHLIKIQELWRDVVGGGYNDFLDPVDDHGQIARYMDQEREFAFRWKVDSTYGKSHFYFDIVEGTVAPAFCENVNDPQRKDIALIEARFDYLNKIVAEFLNMDFDFGQVEPLLIKAERLASMGYRALEVGDFSKARTLYTNLQWFLAEELVQVNTGRLQDTFDRNDLFQFLTVDRYILESTMANRLETTIARSNRDRGILTGEIKILLHELGEYWNFLDNLYAPKEGLLMDYSAKENSLEEAISEIPIVSEGKPLRAIVLRSALNTLRQINSDMRDIYGRYIPS